MRRLAFSQHAEAHIQAFEQIFASETLGRAERAFTAFERGVRFLADFPELGVKLGEGFRQIAIPHCDGSYLVRYRVTDDAVIVTRIWHGKEERR
ncbi:MAG: type II toxin-antitoxin system RelE/ParE family toxin [Vitreimonas sp.]